MPKRLEITPAVIEKGVKRGNTYSEALTFRNRGGEVASYLVEEETGFVKGITPDNIAIEAGKSETVTLTLVIPPDAKVQDTLQAKIVAVNPEDPVDNAEVAIRLKIRIPESWIAIVIVVVVLIIALIWLVLR